MSNAYDERVIKIQSWMRDENIDFCVLCDPDTIYYASGFCGDLGMDFGRPMILVIPHTGECTMITPMVEELLVKAMVSMQDVRSWMDAAGSEWRKHLLDLFKGCKNPTIGIEQYKTPLPVFHWLQSDLSGIGLTDMTDFLSGMKIIKSEDDINIMRQAGQCVALAKSLPGLGMVALVKGAFFLQGLDYSCHHFFEQGRSLVTESVCEQAFSDE